MFPEDKFIQLKNNLTFLTKVSNDGIGHCFIRRQTKQFTDSQISEKWQFWRGSYSYLIVILRVGSESRLQHVFSAVENYGPNQAVGGGGGI